MEKAIITITTSHAPITIAQLGVTVEKIGVSEFELEKSIVEKFEKTYKKSAYFQRMEKAGNLKIIFKELTQDEIDVEFLEVQKLIEEKGKHEDLLGIDHNQLKDIYEEEIGNAPGNRKTTTMIKEIIEKREEETQK